MAIATAGAFSFGRKRNPVFSAAGAAARGACFALRLPAPASCWRLPAVRWRAFALARCRKESGASRKLLRICGHAICLPRTGRDGAGDGGREGGEPAGAVKNGGLGGVRWVMATRYPAQTRLCITCTEDLLFSGNYNMSCAVAYCWRKTANAGATGGVAALIL